MHSVASIDESNESVLCNAFAVNIESDITKQCFVMDMSVLSPEALLDTRLWEQCALTHNVDSLDTTYWEDAPDLPEAASESMDTVLRQLVHGNKSDGVCLDRGALGPGEQKCLQWLLDNHLIEELQEAGLSATFQFTELGRTILQVSVVVKPLRRVLDVRSDCAIQDRSVWELLVMLDGDNWQHHILAAGHPKSDISPYIKGETKTWYTRRGDKTLCQPYLAVLAMQVQGKVKHLQKTSYYQRLITGEEPPPKKEKRIKFQSALEDSWDAPAPIQWQPTPKKKGRVQAVSAPLPIADGEVDSPVVSSSASELEQSSSSAKSSSKSSRRKSSSSSSSSNGSSSNEQKSSSCAGSDAGESAGSVDSAGIARRVNPREGYPIGLNFMTPVFHKVSAKLIGWSVRCNHPDHRGPKKCRLSRNLTSKGRSADETVRMLKLWASIGYDLEDRQEHLDMWDAVVDLRSSDELPMDDDIPETLVFETIADRAAAAAKAAAKAKAKAKPKAKTKAAGKRRRDSSE